MNDIEPPRRNSLGPGLRLNTAQTAVLVFAALYWLSPLDLIPFLPFDDIAVVLVALLLASVFGLFGRRE